MAGESLLAAAQAQASSIPYKNIALGQQSTEMALNAFAKAASVNHQKLALEQQIAALNYRMDQDQEQSAFEREKFEWQKKYQGGEQARKAEALGYQTMFAEERAKRLSDTFNLTTARNATLEVQAGEMGRELNQALQDSEAGNTDAGVKIAQIQNKYASILGTTPANRVLDNFNSAQNQAAMSKHRVMNDNLRKLKSILPMQGKDGFQLPDLQLPEDSFVKSADEQGNATYNIVERPVQSGSQTLWYPISPSEVEAGSERTKKGQLIFKKELTDKYPGLRYRKTTVDNYEQVLKPMYESTIGKISDPNIAGKPQPIEPNTETTRNVNGRKAIFNSQTRQFIRWADE